MLSSQYSLSLGKGSRFSIPCAEFLEKAHVDSVDCDPLVGDRVGKVVDVNDSDFDVATNSDEWVLVDFWAPWCGPCRMVGPVLSQIADEREITIAKVNTDVNPMTSGKFGIRGIPALILFKNGEIVDRMTGAMPKQGMDSWLDRHMT